MNIQINKTETITWDIDSCTAKALVVQENGSTVIKEVTIEYTGPLRHDETGDLLHSKNESYIRCVHKALGELIAHVDKQRGTGRISPDHPMRAMSEEEISQSFTSGHDSIQ